MASLYVRVKRVGLESRANIVVSHASITIRALQGLFASQLSTVSDAIVNLVEWELFVIRVSIVLSIQYLFIFFAILVSVVLKYLDMHALIGMGIHTEVQCLPKVLAHIV